jgi:intracellular sulfur oxidation DsrE/DsrF family protein
MRLVCTLILVAVCLPLPLLADEPLLGPAIEGYGPTYPIDDRDVALEKNAVYRAVFDLGASPGKATALNPRLVSVARLLNMHVRNGTPLENMDLAVVVHGAALKNVLTNEAYRERYQADNPNLVLLQKLQAAGVDIYVCGQSMAFGQVKKEELAGQVQVALSAMTMLIVLQADGYALLP